MKLLIDECLSEALAIMARQAGYETSSHVRWLGLGGAKDWTLKTVILNDDWTFVTRNSIDFRGPASHRGSKGQYAGVGLHAGLICLNSFEEMALATQKGLFQLVLDRLTKGTVLINEVLEITLNTDGSVTIDTYAMPPE